jgi:hypothetical protein
MSEDKKDKDCSKKGTKKDGLPKDLPKESGVTLPRIRKAKAVPAAAGCPEDLDTVSTDVVDSMEYVSPVVPPIRQPFSQGWIPEGWTFVPSMYPGMGVDTYGGFADSVPVDYEYQDDVYLDMYQDNASMMSEEEGGEQNLPGDSLLSVYRSRYQDEVGEPVSGKLAGLVSQIWEKGKDSENLKEIYSNYHKPSNVPVHKVDLNPELMGPAGKFGRARDMKLRAIQAGIARATVPAIRIADDLLKAENIPQQKLMDMSIDTVTILANANAAVNQLRREMIRPTLDRKFQPLCSKMVDNKSELLFGGDFPQQITVLNQGVKIGRGRKFGMNQGFLRKRFQPYQNQRAHGGFRQPFLGKEIGNERFH